MRADLHWHGGEKAIRVISGDIRFRIGSETRVCSVGEIAFILYPHRRSKGLSDEMATKISILFYADAREGLIKALGD